MMCAGLAGRQSQTSIVAKCAPGTRKSAMMDAVVLRCHHPIQRIGAMFSVTLESLDQPSVEGHA